MSQITNAASAKTTARPSRANEHDNSDLYAQLIDGGAVPKTLFESVLKEAEYEIDGLIAGVVLAEEDILGTNFLDQFGQRRHTMVLRIMAHLALQKLVPLELIDCGLRDENFYRVT